MKLKKFHISNLLKTVLATVGLIAIIGFAERKQQDNVCKEVIIHLENQYENFFIDENDILTLMTNHGEFVIQGTSFDDLNLKQIEERVKSERFVKTAQIYRDLKGNMTVRASLRRPYARVHQSIGPDAYIAMDGAILPVSEKYNTRAVVITGDYVRTLVQQNLTDTEEGQKIHALLDHIYNDKFWKAQIAEINIDKNLNVLLYPQVTKQVVEFGQLEDIENKFKKLKVFYKQVLPQKGWNTYDRVNLEYKNQIVAE